MVIVICFPCTYRGYGSVATPENPGLGIPWLAGQHQLRVADHRSLLDRWLPNGVVVWSSLYRVVVALVWRFSGQGAAWGLRQVSGVALQESRACERMSSRNPEGTGRAQRGDAQLLTWLLAWLVGAGLVIPAICLILETFWGSSYVVD